MTDSLLRVDRLNVIYHTQDGPLPALFDVSLDVLPGEIVGIVGESGCGKSTLCSALVRLLPPNGDISRGRILLRGRDLADLSSEEMRRVRGSEISMIFQDPLTSLNPTFTVWEQMHDAQRAHHGPGHRGEYRRRAWTMLERVGIADAEERLRSFPHEFSGGMLQRIMIATALLLEPSLLVADEPTSSLDVTLEAQIIALLDELRRQSGTAIMFASHDLGVVSQICDRLAVMYCGRVVEWGDASAIFARPRHPYTQALLGSVPSRHRRGEPLVSIPGRVPSLSSLPPGCKFSDRCSHSQGVCRASEPSLLDLGTQDVRCHIYDPTSGYDNAGTMALKSLA